MNYITDYDTPTRRMVIYRFIVREGASWAIGQYAEAIVKWDGQHSGVFVYSFHEDGTWGVMQYMTQTDDTGKHFEDFIPAARSTAEFHFLLSVEQS